MFNRDKETCVYSVLTKCMDDSKLMFSELQGRRISKVFALQIQPFLYKSICEVPQCVSNFNCDEVNKSSLLLAVAEFRTWAVCIHLFIGPRCKFVIGSSNSFGTKITKFYGQNTDYIHISDFSQSDYSCIQEWQKLHEYYRSTFGFYFSTHAFHRRQRK